MNLFSSFSSPASAGLPLSQAAKLIFDQGYVIGEGTGDFSADYTYYRSQLTLSIRDGDHNTGYVTLGQPEGSPDPKEVDVMKMSFVFEIVPTNGLPPSPMDEEVWLKESSASLLNKVDYIYGNVAIRELHAGEQAQMNKFKHSPHETSHEFKVIYKNGKMHVQSNVKETPIFNWSIKEGGNSFSLTAGKRMDLQAKTASIMQIEGRSFLIEDAEKSNCETFESLQSMGLDGYCDGNFWIQLL